MIKICVIFFKTTDCVSDLITCIFYFLTSYHNEQGCYHCEIVGLIVNLAVTRIIRRSMFYFIFILQIARAKLPKITIKPTAEWASYPEVYGFLRIVHTRLPTIAPITKQIIKVLIVTLFSVAIQVDLICEEMKYRKYTNNDWLNAVDATL